MRHWPGLRGASVRCYKPGVKGTVDLRRYAKGVQRKLNGYPFADNCLTV